MAVLNSNPEVLLRKRKNNERKKLEKQEQIRQRQLDIQRKKKRAAQNKFVRAETLISNYKSHELESKRVEKVLKHEKKTLRISSDKEVGERLVFVVRIPNHTKGLRIPAKAKAILETLRLTEFHTGVFVKLTSKTLPLLRLISRYIVVGTPSLASVRQLFQKRARITVEDEDAEEVEGVKPTKVVKLDNNQVVEDVFGDDLGVICIEDIIHELVSLGDNFKTLSNWLLPFQLNAPIHGYGPRSKLARLQWEASHERKFSMAGDAPLVEVDIDQFIEEQN